MWRAQFKLETEFYHSIGSEMCHILSKLSGLGVKYHRIDGDLKNVNGYVVER